MKSLAACIHTASRPLEIYQRVVRTCLFLFLPFCPHFHCQLLSLSLVLSTPGQKRISLHSVVAYICTRVLAS